MVKHPNILIVDYGSQYTQVIARTLRELGFRSGVLTPLKAETWLNLHTPQAIILSGGDASVTDANAPTLPAGLLELNIPILGICYGMQLLVHTCGGQVQSTQSHSEYGPAEVTLSDIALFKNIVGTQNVWASHRDTVSKLPKEFVAIASSSQYEYAGVADQSRNIWAVQFHPEVVDTPCGKTVLNNFLVDISKCQKDWLTTDIIADIRDALSKKVTDKKVIVGFSGGVDSTVLSAIISPIFGDNLLGICIDAGHLRKGEIEEVKKHATASNTKLKIVNVEEKFLEALEGVTDAEEKRAVFRKLYKQTFENEVKEWKADFIAQGTLVTDLIESGKTGGAMIKTHHNTGLGFDIEEIAPLDHLFKYEVRALAKELELPVSVSERQPFPGPGLFVRIFGGDITKQKLELVREADAIVRSIVTEANIEPAISQLVVALDCSKTVGVKGDSREYGYNIVVRGVRTTDYMTATGVQFPDDLRRLITAKVTQISGITRVFYDETNKPPATTEFE